MLFNISGIFGGNGLWPVSKVTIQYDAVIDYLAQGSKPPQ